MDETDIKVLKRNEKIIFLVQPKICGKILIFGNDGINKNIFYKRKQPININKIDIKKQQDKKGSFKYFIGYKINADIRPICIKLPH